MRIFAHNIKRLALVTAFAAAALVGGCGGGVEFEGPGFEALGLTGKTKTVEKQVPDRAPLLLPPDRTRLPQPRLPTASTVPQSWPTDPETIRKAETTQDEQQIKDYIDKGDWSKNADIDEFEKLMDPLERSPGIFGGRWLSDKNRDFKSYDR